MLDPITQTVLQEVFRRESRSLLNYASESYPWTSLERRATLDKLRQVIADERRATGELVRFLARRGAPLPYVGSYPTSFTSVNDIALDHLAGMLVSGQRQAITALERDVAAVTDPDAKALLERILTTKRTHLATLETLATPDAATAAS